MAAAIEIPVGFTGLTLTADVYADGSDTIVLNDVGLTEEANRIGYYTGSVTGLSGVYFLQVFEGGGLFAEFWAHIENAGRFVCQETQVEALLYSLLPETGVLATVGSAMTLEAPERSAIAIALMLLADAVENGETFQETMRLIRSAQVGKSNGFPAGPVHFRDKADTKDRITSTHDASGNRLTIATDPT